MEPLVFLDAAQVGITIRFFDEGNSPVFSLQAETEEAYGLPIKMLKQTSARVSTSINRVLAPNISSPLGDKSVFLTAENACQHPDVPGLRISVIMLKFASHDDITWFYTSHPLGKVLFRLQQTAVVSISAFIKPTTDTVLDRESHHASQDDMHTQLFEILKANFPRGVLLDVSKRLPVLKHTQTVDAGPTQLNLSTLSDHVNRDGIEEGPRKRRRVHPSEQAHASIPGRISLDYGSDDGRLTVPTTGRHQDDQLPLLATEPYEGSEKTTASNNALHGERGRKRKLEESDNSTTNLSTHLVKTTSLKTAEPAASSAGLVPNTTSAGNIDYEVLFFPYRPKRPLDSSGDPDLDSLSRPEERIVISYTRMPVKIYLKHKETFFSLYNKSIREDSRKTMTQWKRWAEHGFGLTFRVERIDRLFGMWKVMGLLDELL